MKNTVITASTYHGPNLYAPVPVIRFGLRAAAAPAADAVERLRKRLPGLENSLAACPAHAGAPGDTPGHLFEHACIELQNRAGGELGCARLRAIVTAPAGEAAVPYDDVDVCLAAAALVGAVLADGLRGDPAAAAAELDRRLEEFLEFARKNVLPIQDRAMVRAALARDIPVTQLVGRFLAFGHGRHQQRLSASATTLTNSIASHLAANKTYTHRVLEAAGLPMARYGRAYSVREAVAAAERIGYPVVVKPNSESMGAAVSVGMKNRREVTAAYRRARRLTRSVIVEEFVRGDDHRLLVVNGKLVAAAKRVPAHVVGDGAHSVEELIALVNADPRRGVDHSNTLTQIVLDEQAERLLGELGYTPGSVPKAGEVVYLRRNANVSAGGTAEDLSERVHPANREIAERAAKVIGLDIAGVDLLTSDVSVPLWKNGGRICEINSRPGLRSHLWPAVGAPRDVLGPILDMLFPPGQPVRLPVVAVTGTGDTRRTAQLLAAILTAAGRHVGLAAGRRVFSGGRRVGREKHAPPAAARMILLDPEVDVAVLELRPRDVLRHGLGCDAIDVTVVVDELPEEQSAERQSRPATPPLLDAIRVVARSTRSVIYACHSDPATAAIAADGGQARLCRVVPAPAGRTPAVAAVARGERAVQRGRTIRLQNGARDQGRLRTAAILQRLSGPEADRYRSNALYATLAAHSLGIAPQVIARGLHNWAPLAKLAKPRLPRRP